MWIQHLEWAAVQAATWGPLLIFLFMAIESSLVPFPSEVVMIPAGFLAARGELPLGDPFADAALAVVCGVAGSMAGAYFNYFLALRLGRPVLNRYGRYFFLPPDKLERAEEIFRRYGDITTFVCRLLPAIRQLISLPAGLARMRLGRFSFFTGLGAGIWVVILTWIGQLIGSRTRDMSYADVVHQGEGLLRAHYHWLLLGLALLVVVYVLLERTIMSKRRRPSQESPSAE
jgi:membrane protein DedA with SNARE-associated domain